MRDDNLKLIEGFRTVEELADEARDNATSGIVDEWTDLAEERAWFLFEARRRMMPAERRPDRVVIGPKGIRSC